MSRRHDVRRIKAHLSYSVEELAETLEVHVRTVRQWIAEGLTPIGGMRLQVFAPEVITRFLLEKNKPRQPLAPGEIYCVACKRGQWPAGNIVDVVRRRPTNADFVGECPACHRTIYRRFSLDKLDQDRGTLNVRYEDGRTLIAADCHAPRIASLEDATS